MALSTRRSAALTIEPPVDRASGLGGAAAAGEQQPDKPKEKRERSPLEPLRLLGQTLVWLGGLLLLFAVFQLWGTGLLEWRAQRGLEAEFDELVAEARVDADVPETAPANDADAEAEAAGQLDITSTLEDASADLPDGGATLTPAAATTAPSFTATPAPVTRPPEPELVAMAADSDALPPEGAPIARIDIPAIGVRKTIVQGVERQTLRAGPGHYPTTPMPGEPGNTAIAGHRTTHGSPFLNIDRLQPGDHIDVETVDGVYRYEVEAHRSPDGSERGHFIVHPSEVSVIADQGDDRLTLTACHPRYSARQRIIVTALLVGEPSPEPVEVAEPSPAPVEDLEPIPDERSTQAVSSAGEQEATTQPLDDVDSFQTVGSGSNSLDESLGWRMDELNPTLLWAVVFAVVAFAGWLLARLWHRRWAYALATPVAVVPLFVCFVHLDRLLPAF